jgi:hypothetical protein
MTVPEPASRAAALCGLDQTLYRPEPHILPGETALYFTRDL